MKAHFSRRHTDALRTKKLRPSFPYRLRISVRQLLDRYSEYGGWNNEENLTYYSAEAALKTFYGTDQLETFGDENNRVPANFAGIITTGYPTEFLDAIEAWFSVVPQTAEVEKELNECFSINGSHWRFINGEAILIDSEYLHQEVRAKTLRLLKDGCAFGAVEEFQQAVTDLQTGEIKDAVVKAHKSVESVMKTALQTNDHLTFGSLLAQLIKVGILPEYYEGFLKHFEQLALGVVKERNRPGTGHGQGSEATELPRSLAEFAVNLAGSINLFIIQRVIELKNAAEATDGITTN